MALRRIFHVFILLLVAVLLLGGFYYAKGNLIFNGPSPTARRDYIRENGTDNIYFRLFGNESDLAEAEAAIIPPKPEKAEDAGPEQIDYYTQKLTFNPDGSITDQFGLTDTDGDGIVSIDIAGEIYRGHMLVIWDPTRIIIGKPDNYFGAGLTVAQMIDKYGAIGGINGGGFNDPGGNTDGGAPTSVVISLGEYFNYYDGVVSEMCAIDCNGVLNYGYWTVEQMRELGFMNGTAFAGLLLQDWVMQPMDYQFMTAMYSRTGIGQRVDGAIVMVVIDGYQTHSAGCFGWDLANIFMEYGCPLAYSMDGGASSCMILYGQHLNVPCSMYSDRTLPNGWLIMPIDEVKPYSLPGAGNQEVSENA